MRKLILSTLILGFGITFSCAQIDNSIKTPTSTPYTIEDVVKEMEVPWGFDFLPNGDLLVTEKSGKLFLVSKGVKNEISGVPAVYLRGQGGLMDVKPHPKFTENKMVYLSYASQEGDGNGGHTAIGRGILEGLKLTHFETIYKATPNTKSGRHFGSRLAFDDQGYLYFSIGERGNRDENPQNTSLDGGKIYRIYDDGRIPSDNPFVNDPQAKKAIYSYGHRNPQGLVWDSKTKKLWEHEHGPMGGDEINVVQKGKNFGWPKITYGVNYSGTTITDNKALPGMEQPLYYWVPSIAPSGMAFLHSTKYKGWNGNLLIGSLKFQYLERLVLKNNKVVYREKLAADIGRVRDVEVGPDGLIYIAVENRGIVKLVPKS